MPLERIDRHVQGFPAIPLIDHAMQQQPLFLIVRQQRDIHARRRIMAKALELRQQTRQPEVLAAGPMQAGRTLHGRRVWIVRGGRQHRFVHARMFQIDQIASGAQPFLTTEMRARASTGQMTAPAVSRASNDCS